MRLMNVRHAHGNCSTSAAATATLWQGTAGSLTAPAAAGVVQTRPVCLFSLSLSLCCSVRLDRLIDWGVCRGCAID